MMWVTADDCTAWYYQWSKAKKVRMHLEWLEDDTPVSVTWTTTWS